MKPGTLLIRADANVSIGIGHVMRCLALAQAWEDAGGNAFFAIAEIPEALALRLKSNGFALLPIQATPGGSVDASATVAHASQLRADWVVVDRDRFSNDFCDGIRVSGFRLLLIDDFAERETFSAGPDREREPSPIACTDAKETCWLVRSMYCCGERFRNQAQKPQEKRR